MRIFQKFFDRRLKRTKRDLTQRFPIFVPASAGTYKTLETLTVVSINQTIPMLSVLCQSIRGDCVKLTSIKKFSSETDDIVASKELKTLFDNYGSDKANKHNYHYLYGSILKNRDQIKGVLEVGLGTNNSDVVSNMGRLGSPGASLRAFRDFLPNAKIYGADIDRRILFEEERIKTFYVDQTDLNSFSKLNELIPSNLDLIIDDGLHSPNANIATLKFGLRKIKLGGWLVIEDIRKAARPVWEVVSVLLPKNYQPFLFSTESSTLMFAVKRNNYFSIWKNCIFRWAVACVTQLELPKKVFLGIESRRL